MMNLIVTQGAGSLDKYSQELAKHVRANIVKTDVYQRVVEKFNIPWISIEAAKSVWRDIEFTGLLRSLEGAVHLPNHHMGRYGYFLDKPFVITVHDVIRYIDLASGNGVLIHRPNYRDRYYLGLDYKGVRKAAKIIAVSNYTKADIVKHLRIPPERITVIYEGIDHELYRPVSEKPPVEDPYILYVGSEHPRKNLKALLFAFKKLKPDKRFEDLKLVKVGSPGGTEWDFREDTLRLIKGLGLEGDVIFTGYISDTEVVKYYSHAECYVAPSLYEGFGFTTLEAMACGCPVVTSNVTCIPEIVGDAALLVDPNDYDTLAEAIKKVLTDEALREELREKGFKRSAMFSWERAGKETMKVYEEVEVLLKN